MGDFLRRIRISGRKCSKNAPRPRKLGKTNLRQINKIYFLICQVFMDPRLGTDAPGPGEAVFAIRVNGKPQIVDETSKFQICHKH